MLLTKMYFITICENSEMLRKVFIHQQGLSKTSQILKQIMSSEDSKYKTQVNDDRVMIFSEFPFSNL